MGVCIECGAQHFKRRTVFVCLECGRVNSVKDGSIAEERRPGSGKKE